jgi:hypothetical protein
VLLPAPLEPLLESKSPVPLVPLVPEPPVLSPLAPLGSLLEPEPLEPELPLEPEPALPEPEPPVPPRSLPVLESLEPEPPVPLPWVVSVPRRWASEPPGALHPPQKNSAADNAPTTTTLMCLMTFPPIGLPGG